MASTISGWFSQIESQNMTFPYKLKRKEIITVLETQIWSNFMELVRCSFVSFVSEAANMYSCPFRYRSTLTKTESTYADTVVLSETLVL